MNSFEKLVKEEELPIKLVLVSRLHRDYYAAHETEADIAWAKEKKSRQTRTGLSIMKQCLINKCWNC